MGPIYRANLLKVRYRYSLLTPTFLAIGKRWAADRSQIHSLKGLEGVLARPDGFLYGERAGLIQSAQMGDRICPRQGIGLSNTLVSPLLTAGTDSSERSTGVPETSIFTSRSRSNGEGGKK